MDTDVPSRTVLVTGATGFVGRYLLTALREAAFSVVGLVRRLPPESERVPSVRYETGDVTDAMTLDQAVFADRDFIVHLVGIIAEVRGTGQTFEVVHARGTGNVVHAAQAAGVGGRIVYVSALGASEKSPSMYARTKARAERIVSESGLPFTILRPSLVLGKGGDFVREIEGLIRRPPGSPIPLPFVPIPGSGGNRFQPVDIGDLAQCIVQSLSRDAAVGVTIEIGGADVVTFDEIIQAFSRRLGIKKRSLHIPIPLMLAAASVLEALAPKPPVTVDQLIQLQRDNVCDNTKMRELLGVNPIGFEATLARIYG